MSHCFLCIPSYNLYIDEYDEEGVAQFVHNELEKKELINIDQYARMGKLFLGSYSVNRVKLCERQISLVENYIRDFENYGACDNL